MATRLYVCHFEDDSEIDKHHKGMKRWELGCFPVRNTSYNHYFAMYWTGPKPDRDLVVKKMFAVGLDGAYVKVTATSKDNYFKKNDAFIVHEDGGFIEINWR